MISLVTAVRLLIFGGKHSLLVICGSIFCFSWLIWAGLVVILRWMSGCCVHTNTCTHTKQQNAQQNTHITKDFSWRPARFEGDVVVTSVSPTPAPAPPLLTLLHIFTMHTHFPSAPSFYSYYTSSTHAHIHTYTHTHIHIHTPSLSTAVFLVLSGYAPHAGAHTHTHTTHTHTYMHA